MQGSLKGLNKRVPKDWVFGVVVWGFGLRSEAFEGKAETIK